MATDRSFHTALHGITPHFPQLVQPAPGTPHHQEDSHHQYPPSMPGWPPTSPYQTAVHQGFLPLPMSTVLKASVLEAEEANRQVQERRGCRIKTKLIAPSPQHEHEQRQHERQHEQHEHRQHEHEHRQHEHEYRQHEHEYRQHEHEYYDNNDDNNATAAAPPAVELQRRPAVKSITEFRPNQKFVLSRS
jgi:hypothetical protein